MEGKGVVNELDRGYANRASGMAPRAAVAAFVMVLVALVWAGPAWADTITVDTTNDYWT
jgi:hypothetical protein